MTTLKADDRRRIMLPNAKPGQVFAYEEQSDGAVMLIPVKADRQERAYDPHLYDNYPQEAIDLQDAYARLPQQEPEAGRE